MVGTSLLADTIAIRAGKCCRRHRKTCPIPHHRHQQPEPIHVDRVMHNPSRPPMSIRESQ